MKVVVGFSLSFCVLLLCWVVCFRFTSHIKEHNLGREFLTRIRTTKSVIPTPSLPSSTLIPMYYINLAESTHRRARMEREFASWGSLTRVEAVNASDIRALQEAVDFGRFADDPRYYLKKVGSQSLGEVALCASAHRAIKDAYRARHTSMLLLEDDMSTILAPFWEVSLDEVVSEANLHFPGWDVIQLHVVAYSIYREVFQRWKTDVNQFLVPRERNLPVWGGGATLFSLQGMSKFLEWYTDSISGKFTCWDGKPAPKPDFHCVADSLYFNPPDENRPWHVLMRLPPMFTYDMNEGSTMLRHLGRQHHATASNLTWEPSLVETEAENDNFYGHYQSVLDSLQANIENLAVRHLLNEAQGSLDHLSLEEHVPYMSPKTRCDLKVN